MNETRTTDYALNELQGDEREKFESDLAADQRLQNDLLASSRVADGLAQIMSEPGEGLEPQTREKLLRAIVENQQALRQRRKVVRFAVPIALAAAASIAVLLLVVGGKTTQGTAVAAAREPGPEKLSTSEIQGFAKDGQPVTASGLSGAFTAQINSKRQVFVLKGDGSTSKLSTNYSPQSAPQISQRAESKTNGIRERSLIWPSPETVGLGVSPLEGNNEFLAP